MTSRSRKRLEDSIEQPVPDMPGVDLPCFRPIYQFLFTVLHLFREAWLQKFVDFGNDVGLMKFGDVIRLIDRNRDELTNGELLRIVETHNVIDAVAWVLRHLDETFHTRTLELLALEKHGDEELLANQMQSSGYVSAWGQSMRERLQSKTRSSLRPRRRPTRSPRMSIKSPLFRRGDKDGIDVYFPPKVTSIKSLLFQLVPTSYRAQMFNRQLRRQIEEHPGWGPDRMGARELEPTVLRLPRNGGGPGHPAFDGPPRDRVNP